MKRKRHQAFARFTCVHFLVILVIRRNAPEEVGFLRPCQFASDKVLRPWRLHDLLNQGHAQQFRRKRQGPSPYFASICTDIYAVNPLIYLTEFFKVLRLSHLQVRFRSQPLRSKTWSGHKRHPVQWLSSHFEIPNRPQSQPTRILPGRFAH